MPVQEVLKTLLGDLQKIAKSETVVGEPIRAGDTTIVPVSHVAIGLGVGGGTLDGELPTSKSAKGKVEASGTGAGISVDPVAFIVVTADGRAQLLSLKGGSQISRVIELVPDVLDRLLPKKTGADSPPDEESD